MTLITIGSGSTAPNDSNELSKLTIWAIERAIGFQPKLKLLMPYEEIDSQTGLPVQIQRATSWIQRKVIWTNENAGGIIDYGCRYRAFVAIPLLANHNQLASKFWGKTSFNIIDANSPNGSSNAFSAGTGGTIPSTVDTLPKLLLWLGELWRTLHSGERIFEDDLFRAVPVGGLTIIEETQHGDIAYIRFSVPIPSNHNSVASELYKQALVSSTSAIPDTFLS